MQKADIILLLLILCVVLLMALLLYLWHARHQTQRGKSKPDPIDDETPYTPEEATPPPAASRSEGADYAATHHLWICRYCETMNPIPVGMDGKRSFTCGKPDPLQVTLRGSLANKEGGNPSLRCAACGKDQ